MAKQLQLFVVLVMICLVAGGVLAGVYNFTKGPIARAERENRLKAIRAVLPPFENEPDVDVKGMSFEDGVGQVVFYQGRDSGGNLTGVAFQVAALDGYSGNIDIILGVNTKGGISGICILNHRETPGLGSNITKEKFQAQFIGKFLYSFDFRVEKDGGEVDAITGATISSRAVSNAIEGGLEIFNRAYQ